MNVVYRDNDAKNCSREKRGQFEPRADLESLEQKMQLNREWSGFFHNVSSIHL